MGVSIKSKFQTCKILTSYELLIYSQGGIFVFSVDSCGLLKRKKRYLFICMWVSTFGSCDSLIPNKTLSVIFINIFVLVIVLCS